MGIEEGWALWLVPFSAGAVLLGAVALELCVGDPVNRWHPVALFGNLVNAALSLAPSSGKARSIVFGAVLVMLAVGGVAAGSAVALQALAALSPPAGLLLGAILLKVSFSYRQLESEARRVARHLNLDQLAEARHALRALVARPTDSLPSQLAASAAAESVAENLSDSVVAPLFYFCLFGVPGALAYRAANTLDAMVGYHGRYEYVGRTAAKLDDLANLIPARLTAALLMAATGLARADVAGAFRTAFRDHRCTESPNAGWPMAAMAGALGVRFEKPGHYVLGAGGVAPGATTILSALQVARWCVALALVLALTAVIARGIS